MEVVGLPCLGGWNTNLSVLHVAPSNPDYIYAGTGGSLKYTTDGGGTWNNITLPITQTNTYLAIDENDPLKIYATFSGYSSGNKVFYSTNAGSSWTNLSGSLPNVPVNTIVYQRNKQNRIYVGTDIGVFWRDDNTTSWQDFNGNLPDVTITELEIHYNTSRLRASTYGRGLWDTEIDPSDEVYTPQQLIPGNNFAGVSLGSKIIWNKAPGATAYTLQVSSNSNMSNPIYNSDQLSDTTFVMHDSLFDYNTQYYWRVNSKKGSETSTWSPIWNFKIQLDIAAPDLVLPQNNATNIKLVDSLKWSSVDGVTSYIIQISKNESFSNIVDTDTVNTTFSLISRQPVELGTIYYWRVVGLISGNLGHGLRCINLLPEVQIIYTAFQQQQIVMNLLEGLYLTPWIKVLFVIHIATTTDLSTTVIKGSSYNISVTNPQPYSGDLCGVWFDWNHDGDFTDAGEFYQLTTSNYVNFSTSVPIPQTATKGSTIMRVRLLWNETLTPCETAAWGEVEDYSVYLNAISLATPTLTSPANQTNNVSINTTLNWNTVNNATSYTVVLSKTDDFSNVVLNQETVSNTLNLIGLDYFTNYYWRVKANTSDTSSNWSSTFRFKTLEQTIVLIEPANNASNVKKSSKFLWNKLFTANKYQLQVSKISDFSSLYASLITQDTTYNVAIYNSTKYFWKIRGIYGNDTTSWSSVNNFTTKDSLVIPNLTNPSNGSEISEIPFNFEWVNVNYASNYRIQISTTSNFNSVIYDNWQVSNQLSSSTPQLNFNTIYYWRVLAADFADTTNWSAIYNFKIIQKLATLSTSSITSITHNSAQSGGNITDDGGAEVTARGVCWATTQNPTTSNNKTTNGTGLGSYNSNISGLLPSTTYYVRAYATNSIGTAYGEQISFTTEATVPTVITSNISSVTSNSALTGGFVSNTGGASVTSRGVCWSTSQNPTINDSKTTNGSGTGTYSSSLTGLSANTTYYIRAYATNSAGTGYGEEKSFTTSADIPELSTESITSITHNSAQSGGNITDDGGASVTARGVCWATSQNPTTSNSKTNDGNGIGFFNSSITSLQPNTTYYVRAYATNSIGTAYGEQRSFTTEATVPTVITSNISNITANSGLTGGFVSNTGGASVTSRGVCWSTSQNPTINDSKTTNGSGTGTYSSSLTGLSANTTYYIRAYATNSAGTGYGEEKTFTTSADLPELTTSVLLQ
ncbi:hypothetical protein MASR1M45_30760 [Candidatus Kapaibacterium sp.]